MQGLSHSGKPVVSARMSLQMNNWQTNRGGRARDRREGINDSDIELGDSDKRPSYRRTGTLLQLVI